jgi:methylenetetrahydrofolate reductase (NADPH)
MNVFDIDSVNLVNAVKTMKTDGKDMSGFELVNPPRMFIGAAANPFADPFEYRVIRLAKKIAAGADFIQTQCVYNLDRFREWMRLSREEGLTEKVHILAGITPLKSEGMAKYMAKKVAGMDVPEPVIKRMGSVPKGKAAEEGLKICLETVAELREMKGVHGIHIMAIEWEEMVPKIVESAGLSQRPKAAW